MVDEGSARGGYISTGRDLSIQCFRDEFGLEMTPRMEQRDVATRGGLRMEVYCPII